MQLDHSFTIPVGIDEAWNALLDIERIAPCMPGAAIDSVDGDDFTGTVKVKLGPISMTYKGKASFTEKDAVAHRAVIDARGRDSRGNGTAAAKVRATLTESGTSTDVHVHTDLDITGKPAQFGRGVMVDVGNKLIGQFADSLAATLGSGAGPSTGGATPGVGSAATDASLPDRDARKRPPAEQTVVPAEQAPAEKAAPETAATQASTPGSAPSVAGPDSTAAAAGVQAKQVPASGSQPRTAAQRPQREVEPINLIQSAGPAVAKRLAPLAIAVVVFLGVIRRWRRRKAHA